jgi:hypothetical protein
LKIICNNFLFTIYSIFLILSSQTLFAQDRNINGVVYDYKKKVVPHASVVLKSVADSTISYAITDNVGHFSLTIGKNLNEKVYFIEVTCLGYTKSKISYNVNEKNSLIDIFLQPRTIELKEVEVSIKPHVVIKRDTISYDVTSFSNNADVYIGDVIANMPGMKVSDDGGISYNGKIIKNLYLNGDDLLNGRYGIINKTIPKEMIKKVEIILNDQPIKVLRKFSRSNDIAINLVLKNENQLKWTKDLTLGIGLNERYQGTANAIIFNKKIKNITTLKLNNTGIDYYDEVKDYGSHDYSMDKIYSKTSDLINSGTINPPSIPRKFTFLNESYLFNTNSLYNLSKDWQIVVNLQGMKQHNLSGYKSITNFYLADDTIGYFENQDQSKNNYLGQFSFELRRNTESSYLSNKIQADYDIDQSNSNLITNSEGFPQSLAGRRFNLNNLLRFIPVTKSKNLLDFEWYLNLYSNPQMLNINKGLYPEILNHGQPYNQIFQTSNIPTIFSDASIRYKIRHAKIKQNYQFGIINEHKTIDSKLKILDNSLNLTLNSSNYLQWFRNSLYISPSYQIDLSKFSISSSLPFYIHFINYRDDNYEQHKNMLKLLINPKLHIKYQSGTEDVISLNLSSNSYLGGLNSLYKGVVLTNYRTLQSNNDELINQTKSGLNLTYDLKRSISLLFLNLSIFLNKISADKIQVIEIHNNIQSNSYIPFQNKLMELGINGGISKYLFFLKAASSINVSYKITNFNSYINDKILPFKSNSIYLVGNLDFKNLSWMDFSYRYSFNKSLTKPNNDKNKTNTYSNLDQKHDFSLTYKYKNKFSLGYKLSFSSNSDVTLLKNSFIFSNGFMRYNFQKLRSHLEFELFNIGNLKEYRDLSVNDNVFSNSIYNLRGRMAILHFKFQI